MTALAVDEAPAWPGGADFVVDPATVHPDRQDLVPRYGDPVWLLHYDSGHPAGSSDRIWWDTYPAELREALRRAAWLLARFPLPAEVLPSRAMRTRLGPARRTHTILDWRMFAVWSADQGIRSLDQVSVDLLARYQKHLLKDRGLKVATMTSHLTALTRLYLLGRWLPTADRLPAPPWLFDLGAYLPRPSPAGENAIEPVQPATMAQLLVWALRFVEQFAADTLAANNTKDRLIGQIPPGDGSEGQGVRLQEYLNGLRRNGQPIPTMLRASGRVEVAATYLAGTTRTAMNATYRVLDEPQWAEYCLGSPGPCPLPVPVTARLHGTPWLPAIDFHQAPILLRHLSTACYLVITYLTGMRATESLALTAGCCPDPDATSTGSTRHLIWSRHFKTVRDADGNSAPEGAVRPTPWVAVPQVVRAIRVMERIQPQGLLFPGRPTPGSRSLSCYTMSQRIGHFTQWANDRAEDGEQIPADPHGPVAASRLRRTLAWHIAHQPGGLVALAVQYGHLRTVISEGYASRARNGVHDLLDVETARAMATHLAAVHDDLTAGGGVSGAAAHRLVTAARQAHQSFTGTVLTARQAKVLLADPTLIVYPNTAAFLTCNYNPATALCRAGAGPDAAPSLDRCRSGCVNIARTDLQVAQVQVEAARIEAEAGDPTLSRPVRDRLHDRARTLTDIVCDHEATRITHGSGRTR